MQQMHSRRGDPRHISVVSRTTQPSMQQPLRRVQPIAEELDPDVSLPMRLQTMRRYITDMIRDAVHPPNDQDDIAQAAANMRSLFPLVVITRFLQNPRQDLIVHSFVTTTIPLATFYTRHVTRVDYTNRTETEHNALIFWSLLSLIAISLQSDRTAPHARSVLLTFSLDDPSFDAPRLSFLHTPTCIIAMIRVLTSLFPDFITDQYFEFDAIHTPTLIRKYLFGKVWTSVLEYVMRIRRVREDADLARCLEFINLKLPYFMYRDITRSPFVPYGPYFVIEGDDIILMTRNNDDLHIVRPVSLNPIVAMYRINPLLFMYIYERLSFTSPNPVGALLTAASMLRLPPPSADGQPSRRRGMPVAAADALTGPSSLGPRIASFVAPPALDGMQPCSLKDAMAVVVERERDRR